LGALGREGRAANRGRARAPRNLIPAPKRDKGGTNPVAHFKLANSTEVDVRTESRVHLRALLTDALQALSAIDSGDYTGADSALKNAMLAAHDCRSALSLALTPSPKAQVDAALKDWTT
jgi:hypothetical protein